MIRLVIQYIMWVEAKDEGKWTCNVGVVVNSEVTTASGVASLSLALAPSSLLLLDEFSAASANLSAHAEYEVSRQHCDVTS